MESIKICQTNFLTLSNKKTERKTTISTVLVVSQANGNKGGNCRFVGALGKPLSKMRHG